MADQRDDRKTQTYPIQDEPEGEVRFQYKMSLERMAC
jgi:hypothetical protein